MKNYSVNLNAPEMADFTTLQEILQKTPKNTYSPPLHVITNDIQKNKVLLLIDGKKIEYTRNDTYKGEYLTFSVIAKIDGFCFPIEGEITFTIRENIENSVCTFSFNIGKLSAYICLYHLKEEDYIIRDLTQYHTLAKELRRLIDNGEIAPQGGLKL